MKAVNRTFLVVTLVYLAIVIFIVRESLRAGGEGGLVPAVVGIPTLTMLLVALGSSSVSALRGQGRPEIDTAEDRIGDVAPWGKAGVIIVWLAGLFALVFLVGFYVSVPLYTFAFLKIWGRVSWPNAAVTSAALWVVIYLSFDLLMRQRLFEGIFFGALLPAF